MDFLVEIDTDIFIWLNSRHSSFWDIFMFAVSGKWIWIPLYLSLLYAIQISFGWRTMVLMGVMTALAIFLADQTSASLLRPFFERMRPANPNNPLSEFVHTVNEYRGGRYGFPSSHAANTFALAAITSLIFRRWKFGVIIYLWALVICYSRIYLGVHYPGDILGGLLIGSLFGALCYFFAENLVIVIFSRRKDEEQLKLLISNYKEGAKTILSNIGTKKIRWAATYIPEATILLTFICILIFTACEIK